MPDLAQPAAVPTCPDRALSVRAPWWSAILHLGKDIENRPRPFHYQGRVWLHASAWWSARAVQEEWWDVVVPIFKATEAYNKRRPTGETWASMREAGGAIVGSVELCGSVGYSESEWFFGPWGIKLANPIALAAPVPCKGALGLFRPSADVMEALRHAI